MVQGLQRFAGGAARPHGGHAGHGDPGAGEIALGISRAELATCFTSPAHAKRLTIDDFRDCIDGKSTGAVRISLGIASDFKDVSAFLAFAGSFLDR